jgi:formylglycine-generating enzyme required for sulfatase activity
MCGNVWEWCLDDWHSNYNEAPVDGSCWGEGKGVTRVFRGGGWSSLAEYCRAKNRYYLAPGFMYDFLGFRIALARILE